VYKQTNKLTIVPNRKHGCTAYDEYDWLNGP